MLEAIIPLASTIFGAVGAIFRKREERKFKALELEYGLKHRDYDLKELEMELSQKLQVTQTEAEKEMEISADKSMQASYTAIKPWFEGETRWWLKAVDAFRSLMRPLITIYLLGVTTYITYNIHTLVKGLAVLPSDELVKLYSHIIMAMISLTMTTVGWWFGSRPSQSRG